MVSHFDQERADKLTNRSQPNPSVPWLDGFIKVQDPDLNRSGDGTWGGQPFGMRFLFDPRGRWGIHMD
jgi:hypothetical protein